MHKAMSSWEKCNNRGGLYSVAGCCILLYFLPVTIVMCFGTTNLLNNGSFETEGTTNTLAYYWESGNPDIHGSAWGTAARYSWRHYPTNSGEWCAAICGEWSGAGTEGGWWQEVPAVPGRTYQASAWFWADDGNPDGPWTSAVQGIKMEFFSGEEAGVDLLLAITNDFSEVVQSWQQKAISATAPENADWVRLVVFAEGVSYSGSLQFDEVSLLELNDGIRYSGIPSEVVVTSVVRNGQSLQFSWRPVDTDIQGRRISAHQYYVYSSDSPLFVPDRNNFSNRVYSGEDTVFTASNIFNDVSNRFYYVTAVDTGMLESLVVNDMVCKISHSLQPLAGTSTYAWINVPYDTPWASASNLAAGLDSVGRVYKQEPATHEYMVWDHIASTGTDFYLEAGEAIAVEVVTDSAVHIYGRYNTNILHEWTYNTNQFNHHWLSLPPQTTITTAQELAWQIPACTKVARYNSESNKFESYVKIGTNWLGTDFDLRAQDGILVSVASNSDWQAPLPYPVVEVELEDYAAFIVDVSEMLVTSTVYSGEGALVEYAWDYDGNGVFDVTSSVPVTGFSTGFQNTVTWYPTLRVKNQRGFYGTGSARYDALTMNVSFSNQSFRAGLNETGQVCFTASAGGVFSVYVYDAGSNLISVLESNVLYESGTACLTWDGRDMAGALVSNGVYYVLIQQAVGMGTATYNPSAIMYGSNITDEITGIYVASSFDPYSGGQFPIRYDLPNPARVTIAIENELGLRIGLVCSNVLRSVGTHTEYWDGRLLSGAMISTGQTFNVTIDAVSVGDNVLIVDESLPSIDNLVASATQFVPAQNPYGTGTNSLILMYDLQASADLRIEVRAENGTLIRNALEPGKTVGENQSIWPGTDDAGRSVASGPYSVTVSAESGSRRGDAATVWVEVYY